MGEKKDYSLLGLLNTPVSELIGRFRDYVHNRVDDICNMVGSRWSAYRTLRAEYDAAVQRGIDLEKRLTAQSSGQNSPQAVGDLARAREEISTLQKSIDETIKENTGLSERIDTYEKTISDKEAEIDKLSREIAHEKEERKRLDKNIAGLTEELFKREGLYANQRKAYHHLVSEHKKARRESLAYVIASVEGNEEPTMVLNKNAIAYTNPSFQEEYGENWGSKLYNSFISKHVLSDEDVRMISHHFVGKPVSQDEREALRTETIEGYVRIKTSDSEKPLLVCVTKTPIPLISGVVVVKIRELGFFERLRAKREYKKLIRESNQKTGNAS